MARDTLAIRLRAVFIEELEEQVASLNAALLVLEDAPGDQERLREVFRVAHTLKGASRAAGVPEVEALCHVLEAMLSEVRDGRVPLDARRQQQTFVAADALAEAGRRLRADVPVGDATDEALRQLRGGASSLPAPARATSTAVALPVESPVALPFTPPSPPLESPMLEVPTPEPPPALREKSAPDVPPSPLQSGRASPSIDRRAEERVRISVAQVDLLQVSAAQLRGHVAALEVRPDALRALRDGLIAWRAEAQSRDAPSTSSTTMPSTTAGATASGESRLAGLLRLVGTLLRDAENDARQVGVVATRLADQARRLKLRPFGDVTANLPRAVRDVAQSLGREVRLVVEGASVEADRTVLDALRDPLLHLVRNAIDHGLEPAEERVRAGKPSYGTLVVGAATVGERLHITVADDGRGLDVAAVRAALHKRGRPVPVDDHDAARTLFEGGISTRDVATAISGRGVGLDVVGVAATRLGGSVDVHWRVGAGTTFVLELPVTLATTRALVVDAGATRVAVPTSAVQHVVRVPRGTLKRLGARLVLPVGDELLPVLSLAGRLGGADRPSVPPGADTDLLTMLLMTSGDRRAAVRVDDVLEERDFVAQPIAHAGTQLGVRYSGVILRDADEALPLVAPAYVLAGGVGVAEMVATSATASGLVRARVLVVDDSITTRALESSVLEAAGFEVTTAVDGVEALAVLERGGVDLVVTDVEMPRMDGIALCEAIRRSPKLAALPVIVITSLDQPEQRARGMEAGADAYVTKSSFDQDDFLRAARQLVADRAGAHAGDDP